MADSIICARHGRTSRIHAGTRLCGETRLKVDIDADIHNPERARLRAALSLPAGVCGRTPLDECSACKHPAHAGDCATIISNANSGTEWCGCKAGR